MYLRRNRVRCGQSRRTYLSIAHNIWCSSGTRKAQSRPVVIASFGAENDVDVDLAREIVAIVEKCAPKYPVRRGHGKNVMLRVAEEMRKIEPFLRMLVSRKIGLSAHLPSIPEERAIVLEALVRAQLAEPDSAVRKDEFLSMIQGPVRA